MTVLCMGTWLENIRWGAYLGIPCPDELSRDAKTVRGLNKSGGLTWEQSKSPLFSFPQFLIFFFFFHSPLTDVCRSEYWVLLITL